MTTQALASCVLALDGTRKLSRDLVGGKAYSLNRMRALGMPVPPAFVITAQVCPVYHANARTLPDFVWQEVLTRLKALEVAVGRTFGGTGSPLLLSVRSGAARSMPGMMDTVLNLGLTERLREVLAVETGDARWVGDTWARFCRGYTDTVGTAPPGDPYQQLRAAIGAVFDSWFSERALAYRDRHQIAGLIGTAVTVQAMVFGNRDERSATGVLFSRDPVTGAPELFGEWLPRAQGEDVVSGERTPLPIAALAEQQPENHRLLTDLARRLEADSADVVDIEFTIESGQLFMLQARVGKRSARAAARIAVDMVAEGLISETAALDRITVEQARQLTRRQELVEEPGELARGIAAGPGVGGGTAVTGTDEALRMADRGIPVVLVRPTTSPDDVPAMFAATAVVTEHGGSTSHAALVCREIGLPCVVGCGDGVSAKLDGLRITVDGSAGRVYAEDVSAAEGGRRPADPVVDTLTAWAAAHDNGQTPEPRELPELLATRERLRAAEAEK